MKIEKPIMRNAKLLAALLASYFALTGPLFSNEAEKSLLEQWMRVETHFNITVGKIHQCELTIEIESKTGCPSDGEAADNSHRVNGELRMINLQSVGSVQIDPVESGSVITLWPEQTSLFTRLIYGDLEVEHSHLLYKCSGRTAQQQVGIAPSILLRKQMEKDFAEVFMSYVDETCKRAEMQISSDRTFG